MVSRSHTKNGGRKVTAKIALAVMLIGAQVHSMAYARPFGDVHGTLSAERALNTTELHQGTTQELLQELVSTLQKHQEHQDEPRSEGYVGIHPLPRKRSEFPQKRQGALPQIVPNVAAAASASAPAATSAAPASTQPASSAAAPTIQPASSAAPPKSASASSSSPKPSPSDDANSDSDSDSGSDEGANGVAAFFDPHNKLFPLAIALTIAMGLGVLLVLVSIGKCVSHRQMARDERDGKRKYSTKDNNFIMASAGQTDIGRKKTLGRSIRRALTRGRLGGNSFARREREGTVLIDVGDEVYAVTPEVAKEYERERKSCLNGYSGSSGGSSGGSRLTFPANQSTPLRQALYNAQLIVAANEAEKANGGKVQAPRGFDINSWRRDSVGTSSEGTYSEYDEKTLRGSNNNSKANLSLPPVDPLQRSLSQRLADGLRALTNGEQNVANREKRAFSFDSEMQMPGALRQAPLSSTVPVLTRGGGGWAVQRQQGNDQDEFKPMRKPIRQQQSDSTLRNSALSHDRHVLRDDGPTAAAAAANGKRQPANGVIAGALNNTANGARPKSILVKNAQQKPATKLAAAQDTSKTDLQRRATRVASSTSPGSPKMYQNRAPTAGRNGGAGGVSSTAADAGAAGLPSTRKPIVLKPEMPVRGMNANGGQAGEKKKTDVTTTNSTNTRELYRPLPMPPSFGPIDLGSDSKNGK